MTDRTVVRTFRVAAVTGGALAVIGSVILIGIGHAGVWASEFGAFIALMSVFFAVFVWLVIPRQPRNAVVWTMAGSAFFGGLYLIGLAGAVLVIDDPNLEFITGAVPADLPAAAAWITGFAQGAAIVASLLWITFGLLLFPDGKLPSRRWRWVAWLAGGGLLLIAAGSVWGYRPGNTSSPDDDPLFNTVLVIVVLVAILCLVALLGRFRRSSGATREQFKWIVWGASIFVPIIILSIIFGGSQYHALTVFGALVGEALFLASYGIAVSKYRLFDVDVIISRTVVYGTLAIFITAVYVAIVVGLGTLAGAGDEPNLALAIGATAFVALLFEPVRTRLQRWANRMVYGARASPYAVLSELTARMSQAESDEHALDRLAQLITSGTGATEAVVWLRLGDQLRPEAATSQPAPEAMAFEGGELPELPGEASEPIEHGGELLGALSIQKGEADPVTPSDQKLLEDVAAGAGLLLRNIRLKAELADRAAELRLSRRRLVSAQDLERRRLERDLHDGAQQQVVALKVKLGLARTLAEREGVDQVAEAVTDLGDDAQRAVDGMRAAARGIYPPLLEAEGVRAALVAAGRDASMPVQVETDGFGRYPPEIEATIYFAALEAIGRATEGAGEARVTLRDDGEMVTFSVYRDSGSRPDPGLTAVSDRIEALSGTLTVEPTPDGGETVTGRLPAKAIESS